MCVRIYPGSASVSHSSGEGTCAGKGVTDLCLKSQLADGLAISPRLLRCRWRSQLDLYSPNISSRVQVKRISSTPRHDSTHIVDAEIIQGPGDLNLLGGVKEGVGKLLALTQGALDDLEARDVAQVVAHGLVWVGPVDVGVLLGLEAGVSRMGCN